MNQQVKIESTLTKLTKADPNSPILQVTGRDSVVIKAASRIDDVAFAENTPVVMPSAGLKPGFDYGIAIGHDDIPQAIEMVGLPHLCFGGFHFAPGGNAPAREGGDDVPAINPFSLWDVNFRPACPDPRGMTLVQAPGRRFWCDIYLTGANCAEDGTSKAGVIIADHNDRPLDPQGKKYKRFDYETAAAVMAVHGKGLLSVEEFFAAAFGVTEKTALDRDPKTTGLDAPRTSKFGLMQATGNMWTWGHDGDPDTPRASFLGGSWFLVGIAGSRCASVGDWAGVSLESLGARGRSDHLQPA